MAHDPVARTSAPPIRRWTLQLPKDVPAARTARAALEEWIVGAPRELADAARSVVTELVTNAVRYGRAPIELAVEDHGRRLRIEVTHAGSGRSRTHFKPLAPGRGLQIVAALVDDWGTSEDLSHAWCELAVPAHALAAD